MAKFQVLVVEDDSDLRALICRHLSWRGHEVWEAATVTDALAQLDQRAPDLVVLDLHLPDGSGWDVARYVRGRWEKQLPIVICSSQEPCATELAQIAIQGYVSKPFDHHTLVERVEAALRPEGKSFSPVVSAPEPTDRDVAFYSSLAHDMRTPMATLRTAVESLLAEDVHWDSDAQREFLEAVAISAERVGKFARDVIDLARLDAGALRPAPQALPVEEIHEGLARVLRAQRVDSRVRLHVAPETPPVFGDPVLLHRILMEVIDNALRCSAPGTEVTVTASREGECICWRVCDQGPGIPPEDAEAVFDRYRRLDRNAPHASRGPRLSLYLCRELARAQGGRMWVDVRHGPGACVCLAIPLATSGRAGQTSEEALP